ncbi:MAG: hypothetical protein WDW38_002473 [Sanguina aurantia]
MHSLRPPPQGLLPCDASFLRARALQLLALNPLFPTIRFRALLSSHSGTLGHPPELLGERARRLQRLLPQHDTTSVMAILMDHMFASADILALWWCELELPFQEVFSMGVPPAVFSSLYGRASTAVVAAQAGRYSQRGTLTTDVFPDCDVLQLLERCEVLRELVGPESGYAALCRQPGLLDVAPALMRARVASLRDGLLLQGDVELCRVVEGAPALLALTEGLAGGRADQLRRVLGWSTAAVRALVVARSQVLLLETQVVRQKLLLVREASAAASAAGRVGWCAELLGGQCEADAMARVLLSGWEVLGRVQYLAQSPVERGGVSATDVLEESRQLFHRATPRYPRWWVENGRQMVDELGFEEGSMRDWGRADEGQSETAEADRSGAVARSEVVQGGAPVPRDIFLSRMFAPTIWPAANKLLTEYQKEFIAKKGLKDKAMGPNKGLIVSKARSSSMTTNRADFVPRSAGPVRRHGPAGTIFDSRPFDGRSTYKEMYRPQGDGADRFHRITPPDYSAPFLGASTKQSDYVRKVPFARPATVPPNTQPRVTFNGSSTYTSEFCRKQLPEQDLRKVPDMLPSKNAPNSSMYGIDFVPLPFHVGVAVCCDDNRHPAEHPSLEIRSCTPGISTKQQRPSMSRR